MCLEEVSPKKPAPSGYGYKVYRIYNGVLYSAYMDTLNPGNQWLKAEGNGPDKGFHIYATREKAYQCVRWYDEVLCKRELPEKRSIYKVFKVRYRKATKQGIGDGGFTKNARVILAQEIYIL
jgi:hypothetical protein